MSNELINKIFVEKFRPETFDDLIFSEKETLLNYLKEPLSLPSFIFHSSPGTGKTSCVKLLIKQLDADVLTLNGSKENGVDIVREKVEPFVMSLSANPDSKRCVFYEEGEGVTPEAQKALKDVMEMYSDNSFFIFSTNDDSKLIPAIRSRCIFFNFGKPDKNKMLDKLRTICDSEEVKYDEPELIEFVENLYPDMRKMLNYICHAKVDNKSINAYSNYFLEFYKALKKKDVDYIYSKAYSKDFDILVFNKWYFRDLFSNWESLGFDKTRRIATLLAEIEKSYKIGVNLEIVAIANYMQIMEVL